MAKKQTTKYRREVTFSPDGRSRTFTLKSKEKVSKEEFLEAMIDYIAENHKDCPSIVLASEDIGDPGTLH